MAGIATLARRCTAFALVDDSSWESLVLSFVPVGICSRLYVSRVIDDPGLGIDSFVKGDQ